MKKGYYVIIAVLCFVIAVSIVVLIRLLGSDNTESSGIVEATPVVVVTPAPTEVVVETEEYAVTDDRMNTEDMHGDEGYITKHESFTSTGADYWEPPEDWELPDPVFDTLDRSMLYLLSSMDYTESVKLQYALYMYFGEDLSGLRQADADAAPVPDGVDLYWLIVDEHGGMYALWMDYYTGFIMKLNV